MANGVNPNLRAQQGYRAFSQGLTKPVDMSAIQQGYRDVEGKRRYEQNFAERRAENVGKLLDATRHDLIPHLATNVNARRDKLVEQYRDGGLSYEDFIMETNRLNSDIDNAKLISDQVKLVLPNIKNVYTQQDGRIVQGDEFGQGFLGLISQDGSEQDFNDILASYSSELGNINTIPKVNVEQYVLDNNEKIFDALAVELGIDNVEVQNLPKTTQDLISYAKRKGIQEGQINTAIDALANVPEIANQLDFDYKVGVQNGTIKEDFSTYKRNRVGRLFKREEVEQKDALKTNVAESEAIKNKYKEEEEEQLVAAPYKTYSPSQEEAIKVEAMSTLKKNPSISWLFGAGTSVTSKTATPENIETFRNKLEAARERGDKKIDFEGTTFDITTENAEGKNRADAFIETYDNTLREAKNKFKEKDTSATAYPLPVEKYGVTRDGKNYDLENVEIIKDGDDYYIKGKVDASVTTKTDGGASVRQDIGLQKQFKLTDGEIKKLESNGMLPKEEEDIASKYDFSF